MSSVFASAKKRTPITYGKTRKRLSDYSSAVYKFADDEDELSIPSGTGLVITPGSRRMIRRKSREHEEAEQDAEMSLDVDHHASPVVSMVKNSRSRINGKLKIKSEPIDTDVFDFPSSDDDIPITPVRPTPKRMNSGRTKTPRVGTTQSEAGAKDKSSGNGRRVRAGLPTTPAPEPTSRTYRVTKPAPPTISRSKSLRANGHAAVEVYEAVEASSSTKSGSSSREKPVGKGILKNGGTTSTPARTRVTRSMSAQLEDTPDSMMTGMVLGGGPSEIKETTRKAYARKGMQSKTMTTELVVPKTPVTQPRPTLQQRSSCIASIDTERTVRAEHRRSSTTATRISAQKLPSQTEKAASRALVENSKPMAESSDPTRAKRRKAILPPVALLFEPGPSASPESNASSPGTKRSHMEFELDVSLDIPVPEPTPRKRIVDRLKMNASINNARMSDSDDDSDTTMGDSGPDSSPIRTDSQLAAAIAELTQDPQASQVSQSESQRLLPLDKDKGVHRQRLGPKITYSRQRSFLTEDAQEDALMNRSMLPSALRALAVKEVEPEEEDFNSSDGESLQGKAVKSVHELRETGLNQRYIDEVEGLLDDIMETSLSARRSGYMELARKMLDKAYVHKFSANGFDQKLLEAIGDVKDSIISFAVSSILIALLTHGPTSQTVLEIRKDAILQMLCSQLNNSKDIKALAKERLTNMSKAGISLVVELADEILRAHSSIFSHPPKFVSPRLLASKALERLTHRIRLLEIKDEFLPADTTWTLLSFLAPFGDFTKVETAYSTADKNLLTIPINFLRAYSASEMTFLSTSSDLNSIVTLSSIFINLKTHLAKDDPKAFQVLKELLFIFTNRNTRTAECLAQTKLVSVLVDEIDSGMKEIEGEADLETRQAKADDVVQTIGTLCGLAQNSGAARDAVLLIRETHKPNDWDVEMDGTASSAEKKTYLDVLLEIFNQYYSEEIYTAEKMSEIYIIIVLGYLSVLLGTLAQHPKVRARLLTPTTSTAASHKNQTILGSLAKVIEEFIHANKVMGKLFEIHPDMINNDDGWKGGLNGDEGSKKLEEYQQLRDRLLLWNGGK